MSTAVFIVSYNTKSLLRDCLRSFIATQTGDYELRVLDNNSSDGSADMVEAEFPQVKLIRSEENVGFGAGNNILANRSDSDYALLINPDTLFTEDILGPMIDYLQTHSDVGVVGPKIVGADGELQLSCERFPSLRYELAWQLHDTFWDRFYHSEKVIAHTRMEDWDRRQPAQVEFLWATCWLVRRELIRGFGLFDETFRMYDEDMDFCARLAKTHWQMHYFPLVTMTHLGGMSSSPVKKQIMMRRGRYLFYRRHRGRDYALAYRVSMGLLDIGKAVKHFVLALLHPGSDHWERAKGHARLARS
ncbi:MAG: glycosyltransferase family 2 protein [Armatimonadetes bacterium]|nr:glycosyltransferase family 2 protein [Armatimonadota bacterium]